MVVGTQKSATTWLFECLAEHPEVLVPELKEVHYFCRPEDCRFSRKEKGLKWYESLFANQNDKKALGELTTDYMYYPYVAQDLYDYNPELKIIFMLRNPVDRAYSAYWMGRRHRMDMQPFEELLESATGYIERGYYYRQVKPYVDLFGKDKVKIYIYEEINQDKEAFISDLFCFLDVDSSFVPASLKQMVGKTKPVSGIKGFIVYKILSRLINTPVVLPLWRFLRRKTNLHEIGWGLLTLGKSKSENNSYPDMEPSVRNKLVNIFQEENERLYDLMGKTIPDWEI